MTRRFEKSSQSGFTIVELLVAGTVLAIITSFFLSSLTIQKRNYTINDQITEIQQGARIIGDVIERDLRHAGFMAPDGGALCLIDSNGAPDVLLLSDSDAVQPGSENRGDLAARVSDGRANVAAGLQTLPVDSVVVEVVDPTPSYDSDADGANDSDFRVGAGVIAVDAANPERGVACARVTRILSPTSIEIDVFSPVLNAAAPSPPDLALVPARIYLIDGQNRLVRDGIVVASDVEDLQVAIFLDDDEDGDIDPGEYRGGAGDPGFDNTDVNVSLAREARVSFVLRTRDADPSFSNGTFQSMENRAPVAGNDGFRRRAWVSTIMLRNVPPKAT